MAIVNRMYAAVGPSTVMLQRTVPSASVIAQWPMASQIIQVDDADPGSIIDLDQQMLQMGWVYDPSGHPWWSEIQVLSTDAVLPTIYANNAPYIQMARLSGNFVVGGFWAPCSGNVEIATLYAMSNANTGDVEMTFSYLNVAVGSDPSAVLTATAPFVFTPGNDANQHLLGSVVAPVLIIPVTAGDNVIIKQQRSIGGLDTHTGDLRIQRMVARMVS